MKHADEGASLTIDKAEEASNIFIKLTAAVVAHPFVALIVLLAVCVSLCFLPNGVITALIARNTEMRKLDQRVDMSRKKLSSNRQNRKRNG